METLNQTAKKSIFQFRISQSIDELLENMEKRDGKDWKLIFREPCSLQLMDPDYNSFANIWLGRNICKVNKSGEILFGKIMIIKTAWSGFEYDIRTYPDEQGSEVRFYGPLNGLLTQLLLPRMSYVPHTLMGKYENMAEFVSIDKYCQIREERHAGQINKQDSYGGWVNLAFNNEIPSLPAWVDKKNEEPELSSLPVENLTVC